MSHSTKQNNPMTMSAIGSSNEPRATSKVSRYPSTTLQPLGPSSNPLPSNFTVVFVESYNPQRHSRVVHPEAYTPGHALDEIETTTSGNQHLRVYTNQPWAVMDEEVCSLVDTLSRSCLHVGSDPDLTKSLQGIVERTGAFEAGGEDGPRYVVATQAQTDEWLRNRSIIEFHKAKTQLPFEVQEMLSSRPTITVGSDNGFVHAFTNNTDELSKPMNQDLVKHLQSSLPDAAIMSTHEWQTNLEQFPNAAVKNVVNAIDSGLYSLHWIDSPTCEAFLSGHCRGIAKIDHQTLSSIASHSAPRSGPVATGAHRKKIFHFRSLLSRSGGDS